MLIVACGLPATQDESLSAAETAASTLSPTTTTGETAETYESPSPVAPLCNTIPQPDESGLSEAEYDAEYGSVEALYARATAGEVQDTHPEFLGSAVALVPPEYFEQTVFTYCTSHTDGGITFEAMSWSNGIGSLDIWWQEWPEAGDPGAFLTDEVTTENVDGVQIIESSKELIIAGGWQRINTVRYFDGNRVVSLQTVGLSTTSIDELHEMGLILWEELPVAVP